MNPGDVRDLQRLLSALIDGGLADDEYARLEALLAADPAARRLYLEYMDVHARLLAGPPGSAIAPPTVGADRPRWSRYALVAATSLAASLLVQLVPFRSHPGDPPGRKPSETSPTAAYVATLSQAAECVWEGAGGSLPAGSRLLPGELRLRAGVARVRFDGGPALTVQGPAVLRVDSATAATLLAGRVVFADDETSVGFDLRTPRATLTDTGTEYAVAVGPDGEEVHVFGGGITRIPNGAAPAAAEQLSAGEARRYGPDPGAPGRAVRLDPDGFARGTGRRPPHTDPEAGRLAYEGFGYADPQALDADAAGGSGWDGPWRAGLARPADPAARGRGALDPTRGLARPRASVPPVGGCFDFAGFAKYYRRLATPVRMDADGLYYLSFLLRRDGPPADRLNAAAVLLRTTAELGRDERGAGADPRQRLNVGVDQAGVLFTHLNRRGGRVPLPLSDGVTYLITAKVVASRSHPDQVFVRVYGPDEPVDTEEPTGWTLAGPPVASDLVFDWLEVHINSRARQSIDEVRIGTTWSSVAACWSDAEDRER